MSKKFFLKAVFAFLLGGFIAAQAPAAKAGEFTQPRHQPGLSKPTKLAGTLPVQGNVLARTEALHQQ